MTMKWIATTTPTGQFATFSSIPSTYKDLVIYGSAKSNSVNTFGGIFMRFNGISSSVYKYDNQTGSGASTRSGEGTWQSTATQMQFSYGAAGQGSVSGVWGNVWLYIANYASSSEYKFVSYKGGHSGTAAGEAGGDMGGGVYLQTTPISSIAIEPAYGSAWVSGTKFHLFGINNS